MRASYLLASVALGCAMPAAAIDTVWNFDSGLNAASGSATMSFLGDTAGITSFYDSEHELGLAMPFGDHGGVMQFGATTPTQGLGIDLNNGGATVNQYTLVYDLFRPAPSWNEWMPLLQTDLSNSTDGDFFISPGDGIGISGDYDGRVTDQRGNIAWNRVVMTYDNGTMNKYIDGQLVGTQNVTGSRWEINGGFNILQDENNESAMGFISSFRFTDSVMSAAQVAQLGGTHAGGAGVAGQQLTADPSVMTAGGFTIAVIGDTQNYSSGNPGIFNTVTDWVADQADDRNIVFAIQDGDIVNSGNSTTQWNNARAAMERLDGVVPYAVVRGNHDIGSQFDLASRFGNGSPYSQQPTLTGHYEVPGQPDWDMRNTYHTFEAGGQKFLVLTVDISAGDDVVDWANQVIAANGDHRVILDTHAYNYDGGQRFNNADDPHNPGHTHDESRDELLRSPGQPDAIYNGARYGGQDAQTLWENLVSRHPNIAMFISGHQFEDFDQFKYHLDEGVNGNDVYELLVDPQHMANGGDGWIRLLEFDPDGQTVHVKTYSPHRDEWDTAPDVYFDITLTDITRTGDFNGDDYVGAQDLDILLAHWGDTVTAGLRSVGDADADGVIGDGDLQLLLANWGTGTPPESNIPEPGTCMLLMLGGLSLRARRRRL